MRHKTRLERLRREAAELRRTQDDAQRRERERLDRLTDDELARELAMLRQAIAWFQDGTLGKEWE